LPKFNIIEHPNEILKKKCGKVSIFNKTLWDLLDNMYETMLHYDGVGLAAPQIGISRQIAIVDISDKNGKIELINPVILEIRGEEVGIEGCLSFPGIYGDVARGKYVKIRAQNRQGNLFIFEGEGYLARAIQHEIDHLHGKVFTEMVLKYYDESELEEA
jgi:peptide deformylase